MWMIKNRLMPAVMLVAFAMVASSPANAQGTPDGETPANEGVCDDLLGGTPGLYGLCVGFCEAQDCEASLHVSTGEVIVDHCKPSSPRLLENYKKRMQPGDPSMPCVVEGECPCWTEAEIETLGGVGDACAEINISTAIDGFRAAPGGDVYELAAVIDPNQCIMILGDPDIIRFQSISSDDYLVCHNSIRAECADRGIPLP